MGSTRPNDVMRSSRTGTVCMGRDVTFYIASLTLNRRLNGGSFRGTIGSCWRKHARPVGSSRLLVQSIIDICLFRIVVCNPGATFYGYFGEKLYDIVSIGNGTRNIVISTVIELFLGEGSYTN